MNLNATRSTQETDARVDLTDAGGAPTVELAWEAHGGLDEEVDEAMAEHLFGTLLHYAGLSGELEVTGDLAHHVVEDAAITLGTAIGRRVETEPLVRFAEATIPMDEALVQVVLDAGGRAFYDGGELAAFSDLWHHVARTIAFESSSTLHVRVLRGADRHHVVEAAMKALGTCLGEALQDAGTMQSTKGEVRQE